MGKFPSRSRTLGVTDLLARAKTEADNVKGQFTSMLQVMEANPLSVTNLIKVAGGVAAIRLEVTPVRDNPDIMAYVKEYYEEYKDDESDLAADAQVLLDAAENVQVVIRKMIPADKEGYLAVCKFDTDGTLAWRSYQPSEMTELKDAMQAVVDAIH